MKTMSHLHMPRGDGKKHPIEQVLGRIEGSVTEYLTIALVIALGAAMAFGLLMASGAN